MKIVLVGPAFPYRGGIAETTNSLYSVLTKRGHDVVIVGFKKQFPKLLFPGKTQFDTSRTDDIPSTRLLVPWNPLSWYRTAKFINKQNADLVCYKWWMPFFGAAYWGVSKLLDMQSRARVAFVCHNVIPHETRIGDKTLSKMALGQSKFFLTFSRNEAHELEHLFPKIEKKHIRHTALPLFDRYDEFKQGQAAARAKLKIDAKKLLLFMGLIRQYKGLDILLRAMPEIIKQDSDIKLVIAGEFYEEQAKYDKLIDELGIRNHVIVRPGYVPADEIGVYLAAADVNVLPYRSATQSAILVLAYAHGCPVITTNVGGLAEVVEAGKTGFVVEPEDSSAIASAVHNFYSTGGRTVFEPHVRTTAEKFSWDRPCEILEEFAQSN